MKYAKLKRPIFYKSANMWLNPNRNYEVVNDTSFPNYVIINYLDLNVIINKNDAVIMEVINES